MYIIKRSLGEKHNIKVFPTIIQKLNYVALKCMLTLMEKIQF